MAEYMEFYVVNNTTFEIVGIIDSYKSAIWTERYYSSGDFELYIPATDAMIELLQKDFFVVRTDDTSKAMIIEAINITTDAENGNYITVTGRSVTSILSRRIVWKQTTYSGNVEKTIRRLITHNFIEPELSARQVEEIALGDELGLTDTLSIQYTGDNVETAIQDICKSYKIGYKLEMDMENRQLIFVLYQGTDRSYNQSSVPFVIFSPDFENLLSSDYKSDNSSYKNVAQVAGSGEGNARIKTTVGDASGINRCELFVNASQLSDNDGEIDSNTYLNLLYQKGVEELANVATQVSMDSEVAPNETYKLNADYFLGDVVEVINEYGIAMTPRVTEVIESQSDTGYTCIPTFATDDDEA